MALSGHVWEDPLPNTRGPGDNIPIYNDINLSTTAIRRMQTAGLLTVEDATQGLATVNRPTNFILSDTEPPNMDLTRDVWINTGGATVQESGYFADRASSPCTTVPFMITNGALTLTSGSINAARAINKTTKQYTAIRTHVVAQTTAATDMFLGVWAADGTLLGATANIASSAVVGTVLSAPLATPISLSAGTPVFLGISAIGGSGITVLRFQVGGGAAGTTATMTTVQPDRLSWSVTGNAATSSAPPALSGTTQVSSFPWIELV